MTLDGTVLVVPVKAPDVVRQDRHAGLALATVVGALVLGAVLLAMRRLRARVEIERADRSLRESIDRLEP